jgi:hypothetical protein
MTGIYLCAAPFVDAACNDSSGCATDCATTSCGGCPAGNEAQCQSQVNQGNGQCKKFIPSPACLQPAIGPAGLCRYDNKTFGTWLRVIGNHFCGNGP